MSSGAIREGFLVFSGGVCVFGGGGEGELPPSLSRAQLMVSFVYLHGKREI